MFSMRNKYCHQFNLIIKYFVVAHSLHPLKCKILYRYVWCCVVPSTGKLLKAKWKNFFTWLKELQRLYYIGSSSEVLFEDIAFNLNKVFYFPCI